MNWTFVLGFINLEFAAIIDGQSVLDLGRNNSNSFLSPPPSLQIKEGQSEDGVKSQSLQNEDELTTPLPNLKVMGIRGTTPALPIPLNGR
ncbi:CIC11C00000005255 [Sungouiella intermedia]|uniref:CIC11C00000005255 n=1 Tax=Sungouiella intermedia TaxID=45354 RepID=A0A1L0BWM5_9ASCO|nr:CIC11C00000005255 [[Candida] intermedia]